MQQGEGDFNNIRRLASAYEGVGMDLNMFIARA